jgi:hypothetical protein
MEEMKEVNQIKANICFLRNYLIANARNWEEFELFIPCLNMLNFMIDDPKSFIVAMEGLLEDEKLASKTRGPFRIL